jgi:parallel beta-helix repeat protein
MTRRGRQMRSRLKITIGIAVALLGASLLALSDARAVSTTAITCGMVVTTNIKADNDLNNCATMDGLVVGANNITINLNGHLVDGDDTGDNGIDNTGGFDNVKITNGRITDFGEGVELSNGADGNQLVNLEIRSNGFDGVDLSSAEDQATITGNRMFANGGKGIELDGNGHKVENNYFVANADGGIGVRGDMSRVKSNIVTNNGGDGIAVTSDSTGNTIEQNLVAKNGSVGIFLNGADVDANVVKSNRSTRNTQGIILDGADGNTLDRNTLLGNSNDGIWLRNDADQNLVKKNDAAGNASGAHSDATSDTTVFDGNTLSGNSDGLKVEDAGATTTIRNNKAYGNSDRGIEAASGIDGGGNKAAGNVNPQQCQVVVCS